MKYIQYLAKILNEKEKKKFIYIAFLMFLNTLFELLSIGMILPVLSILFGENFSFLPNSFYNFIQNFSQSQLITFTLISIILIILLKNLFILFYNYQQSLYAKNIQVRVAGDIFAKYIFQNYLFFLKKNTGTILRNVNTSRIVSLCLISYLTLLLEFIIISIFFLYLFYINYVSTLVVSSIFVIFGITLYKFTRNKLYNWSSVKQDIDAQINQQIIQTFSLIKNVKIFNKEKKMFNYFHKLINKFENLNLKVDIVQQIPKISIEVLGVITLSTLIIILLLQNINPLEIIAIIAIYALVIFRIIPSTTRIVTAFQRIKMYAPSMELIKNEYLDLNDNFDYNNFDKSLEKIRFKKLEFKNVSFSYDKNNLIINKLNFHVNNGDIIGIYGESGSGKSTLVNLISGLLKPSEGTIEINNQNLEVNKGNWLASLGYVPQQAMLFNASIADNVSFFENQRENIDFKFKLDSALKKSNMDQFMQNLPNKENSIVGENASKLSGGQIQRLGIARALFNDPDFLIFDEATNALDNENESEILKTIFELKNKKTIIIISHDKNILNECEKIFEFKNKTLKKIK